ncbi:MAG: hypothetical protein AAGA26_10970 [Pseudomonadota bacterium]
MDLRSEAARVILQHGWQERTDGLEAHRTELLDESPLDVRPATADLEPVEAMHAEMATHHENRVLGRLTEVMVLC